MAAVCGLALATASKAQNFSFSGSSTYFDPFSLGILSDSTDTFSVSNQFDQVINSWNFGDGFGFYLTTDAAVILTLSPGANSAGMGINLYDGTPAQGQIMSIEYINPYDTVSGAVALPAGSYIFNSSGSIPDYDQNPPYFAPDYPYVYAYSYSGSITVVSLPVFSIGNASVAKGTSGTTSMIFNVSLSQSCPVPVAVDFVTADGTAISGYNYDSTSGTLLFAPGQTNLTIPVTVNGGSVAGPEANFFVNLNYARSGNVNLTIANAQAIGAILNEAFPPAFQSVMQTNGMIDLVWSVVPGQTYQLQSSTNLSSTRWLNFGSSVMATNTTVCASDSMTNSQCFYRIMLLQ
jgi:hypothetical protein